MDSIDTESIAASSTAQTGDSDGAPSHQPDQAKPPAETGDHSTGSEISEGEREKILAQFTGGAEESDEAGSTEQDQGVITDTDQDHGDQGAEQDQAEEGSTDIDSEDAAEVADDEKSRKAFAKQRKEIKAQKAELEELKPEAEYGRKVKEILGTTSESDLERALQMIATQKSDPLKAIKSLREQLGTLAEAARAEYGDDVVESMLGSELPKATEGGADWKAEHPELAKAVENGIISEAQAMEYISKPEAEPKAPEPEAEAEREAPKVVFTSEWHSQTNRMLLNEGFFEGISSQEDRKIAMDDHLLPLAHEIMEEKHLDGTNPAHISIAMEQAARQLVSERRAKKPAKKKSGRPLSTKEGAARGGDGGKQTDAQWKKNTVDEGGFS